MINSTNCLVSALFGNCLLVEEVEVSLFGLLLKYLGAPSHSSEKGHCKQKLKVMSFQKFHPSLKRKMGELYRRSCDRHEGDLYLWLQMDRREKKLLELEKEMDGCGICTLRRSV